MPFEIGGEKHSKETVEAMNEVKQMVKKHLLVRLIQMLMN